MLPLAVSEPLKDTTANTVCSLYHTAGRCTMPGKSEDSSISKGLLSNKQSQVGIFSLWFMEVVCKQS